MKKIFSYMAGLAVLAAAGSCQEPIEQPVVEQTPVVELEYQDVTFNVAAPSGPQTRTIYGETVTFPTELHVAVYVAKGNENPDKEGTWLKDVKPVIVPKAEGEGVINTEWEVTISLVKSYSYDIVFWAQKKGSDYYDIDWQNATITADYTVAANDVTRDAFYHVAKGYNYLTANEKDARIQLTRPFAQINLGASDYAALIEHSGFVNGTDDPDLHTTITSVTASIPNVLNVLTSKATGDKVVKFTKAATTDLVNEVNDIEVTGTNAAGVQEKMKYKLVGSNYIFANPYKENNPTVELDLTFAYNGKSFDINVPNVPYARNYQTNILGNFFTSNSKFNVVIVPGFNTEFGDEYVHVWDGYSVSEPAADAEGNYRITVPAELAWVAQQVNSGKMDFAGKTLYVTDHLRLGDFLWTPIGTSSHPFKGNIESLVISKAGEEYYAISGLNVKHTAGPAGLIGVLEGAAKNITLDSPTVAGKSDVGAVAGHILPAGSVEGAVVTNGSVSGEKNVGGVAGKAEGAVKENVVDEIAVEGESSVGAVAGSAVAANVSGNDVQSADIKGENAGVIAGTVVDEEGKEAELDPEQNAYNHKDITVNDKPAEPAYKLVAVFSEAEIPAEGGETVITITGNAPWTVTVPEGVTAEPAEGKGEGQVTVTIPVNETFEQVTYEVVVATEKDAEPKEYKNTYVQAAAEEVVLEPSVKTVTVAEFLAAAEDETVYQLTGVITSVVNTTFGNFYLKDATGEVYIYGLCSPDGAQKYWAESGAKVGDQITVQTVRTSYKDAPQGKDAIFVELVPFVAQASEWGVVGDLNEWGKTPDVVMYNTWHTEDLYVAYNVEIASGAFKIRANNEWNDDKNYGLEVAGNIYADKYYSVIKGSGSQNATPMTYGTYDVYFDLTNKRVALMTPGKAYAEAVDGGQPIVVVAGLKDHEWGVAGSFQGWDAANAVVAEVEGDWAVAKNVTLAANDEFKFVADKAWAISYGSACDVNVGETYTSYIGGGNMKFVGETGTYNLYFSLIDAKFYMEKYVAPEPEPEPDQPVKVTYNHTFAKGQLNTKAEIVTLSGVAWDFSGASYIGWDSNASKGIQMGSSNNPVKSATLSTSEITGSINVIKVNSSVGSSGDGKLAVYVGGVQYGKTVSLTTSATEYTFDIAGAMGEIEIRWTNTAKAMYVKSISVEYLQ